jgi:hypothetical protein
MTDYTRSTHTVRIKGSAKDGSNTVGSTALSDTLDQDYDYYVDVEVLDAISLVLPNGFEIAYAINAAATPNCVPAIIDNTGDGNDIAPGDKNTSISAMQQFIGDTDPTQIMDVQVCLAVTMTGPDGTAHVLNCPPSNSSDIGGPETTANPRIIDDTDSGLAQDPGSEATRLQHVAKILAQDDPQTYPPPDYPSADNQTDDKFLVELITDAIAFDGPVGPIGMPSLNSEHPDRLELDQIDKTSIPIWGEQFCMSFVNPDIVLNGALSPAAECKDTTQYVTDPQTGYQVPPDNTDPNVYVYFPVDSQGPFVGLGKDGTGKVGTGIDMGPIWWITQAVESNLSVLVNFQWRDGAQIDVAIENGDADILKTDILTITGDVTGADHSTYKQAWALNFKSKSADTVVRASVSGGPWPVLDVYESPPMEHASGITQPCFQWAHDHGVPGYSSDYYNQPQAVGSGLEIEGAVYVSSDRVGPNNSIYALPGLKLIPDGAFGGLNEPGTSGVFTALHGAKSFRTPGGTLGAVISRFYWFKAVSKVWDHWWSPPHPGEAMWSLVILEAGATIEPQPETYLFYAETLEGSGDELCEFGWANTVFFDTPDPIKVSTGYEVVGAPELTVMNGKSEFSKAQFDKWMALPTTTFKHKDVQYQIGLNGGNAGQYWNLLDDEPQDGDTAYGDHPFAPTNWLTMPTINSSWIGYDYGVGSRDDTDSFAQINLPFAEIWQKAEGETKDTPTWERKPTWSWRNKATGWRWWVVDEYIGGDTGSETGLP